jgi:lipoate-protein ligase A
MLIQLKFKNTISEKGKNKLRSLLFNTMHKTLVELGVPDSSIANLNNDLLINGRKVAGTEYYLKDNIYCSSVIFTLKFKQ